MAPIEGDPSLVDELRHGAHRDDVDELLKRAARCWDRYGLPGDKEHWTVRPTEKDINEPLDTLLRPVLDPADRWLLDIPRVLVPDRSSAYVVLSRKGAALGMPWSAFGGMFFVNALSAMFHFAEHVKVPADRARRTRRPRRKLSRRLPPGVCAAAIRHWLSGIDPPPRWARAVTRLEAVITLWMHWSESRTGWEVWASTVFQQAVMTLHEFAHIVDLGRNRPTTAEPRAFRCSLTDELGSDQWSRRHVRRLAEILFRRPEQVISPLLDLFSALDIAELPNPDDARRSELTERCALLINSMHPTPVHQAAVQYYLANVRALYNRPEKFLLDDFRRYDLFLERVAQGVTYLKDREAYVVVDENTKRWT